MRGHGEAYPGGAYGQTATLSGERQAQQGRESHLAGSAEEHSADCATEPVDAQAYSSVLEFAERAGVSEPQFSQPPEIERELLSPARLSQPAPVMVACTFEPGPLTLTPEVPAEVTLIAPETPEGGPELGPEDPLSVPSEPVKESPERVPAERDEPESIPRRQTSEELEEPILMKLAAEQRTRWADSSPTLQDEEGELREVEDLLAIIRGSGSRQVERTLSSDDGDRYTTEEREKHSDVVHMRSDAEETKATEDPESTHERMGLVEDGDEEDEDDQEEDEDEEEDEDDEENVEDEDEEDLEDEEEGGGGYDEEEEAEEARKREEARRCRGRTHTVEHSQASRAVEQAKINMMEETQYESDSTEVARVEEAQQAVWPQPQDGDTPQPVMHTEEKREVRRVRVSIEADPHEEVMCAEKVEYPDDAEEAEQEEYEEEDEEEEEEEREEAGEDEDDKVNENGNGDEGGCGDETEKEKVKEKDGEGANALHDNLNQNLYDEEEDEAEDEDEEEEEEEQELQTAEGEAEEDRKRQEALRFRNRTHTAGHSQAACAALEVARPNGCIDTESHMSRSGGEEPRGAHVRSAGRASDASDDLDVFNPTYQERPEREASLTRDVGGPVAHDCNWENDSLGELDDVVSPKPPPDALAQVSSTVGFLRCEEPEVAPTPTGPPQELRPARDSVSADGACTSSAHGSANHVSKASGQTGAQEAVATTYAAFVVKVPCRYPGLQYRRSKDLDDRWETWANADSEVRGVLEDRGAWLRVSPGQYLPVEVAHMRVLIPKGGLRGPSATKHTDNAPVAGTSDPAVEPETRRASNSSSESFGSGFWSFLCCSAQWDYSVAEHDDFGHERRAGMNRDM